MGKSPHSKMKIVIIGAGNVATHLSQALSKQNEILQIYSRNISNAEILCSKINGANPINKLQDIRKDADFYIISIKDDAISQVVEQIAHINDSAIWVHTSGSVPMDVFEDKVKNYGVFYPLQTFSKNVELDFNEIPLFIEASTTEAAEKIKTLARTIVKKVYDADSKTRKQMHIAAVFACNFANHLWTIADDILAEKNLPFDVLMPLIKASVEKIGQVPPKDAQTGPAARNDLKVIGEHLKQLSGDNKQIYQMLTDSIIKHNNE